MSALIEVCQHTVNSVVSALLDVSPLSKERQRTVMGDSTKEQSSTQ